MIYNVAQLLKAQVGATQVVELDNADELNLEDEDVKLAGPVTGRLRMRRTNQGILVDGPVEALVELSCVRCLDMFTLPISFHLEEQFYPTIDVVTGLSLPQSDNELIFPIDQNHQLDLREAIRQNLLLALPMQPICKEDCAGLCPQCGKNLNEGACDCQPPIDERLSVLGDLLKSSLESEQPQR
ncbi:MAG TPA: DUF177 domain-containing protein [Ktedonobacterales bacterium]|nr:DUF177 domain-containing protein [Ktedonobacterales bacterium]